MNRRELVREAASKAGLSQVLTAKALEALLDTISESLKNDVNIQILGFGSFSVAKRSARNGFNPATLKPIKIKAKKVVKFNPSKDVLS